MVRQGLKHAKAEILLLAFSLEPTSLNLCLPTKDHADGCPQATFSHLCLHSLGVPYVPRLGRRYDHFSLLFSWGEISACCLPISYTHAKADCAVCWPNFIRRRRRHLERGGFTCFISGFALIKHVPLLPVPHFSLLAEVRDPETSVGPGAGGWMLWHKQKHF